MANSFYCNNADAVAFVNEFAPESRRIAGKLGVPTENVLGLAAQESQYGTGRIASDLNNYFSMHSPAPLEHGSEAAQKDAKVKVAIFKSFGQSGDSFVIKYGSYVQNKTDPKAFAEALLRAHFNSGDSKLGGRTGFVDYLVSVIGAVKARMSCAPQ